MMGGAAMMGGEVTQIPKQIQYSVCMNLFTVLCSIHSPLPGLSGRAWVNPWASCITGDHVTPKATDPPGVPTPTPRTAVSVPARQRGTGPAVVPCETGLYLPPLGPRLSWGQLNSRNRLLESCRAFHHRLKGTD